MFYKKLSAFTLIELLVVIVIIGILATIGIAQFNTYQEKARLARAQSAASQAHKKILAETVSQEKEPHIIMSFDNSSTIYNEATGEVLNFTPGANFDLTTDSPYPTGNSFDATSGQQLSTSLVSSTNQDDFTLSLWLKVPSFPGNYYAMVHKSNVFSLALNGDDEVRLAHSSGYTGVTGIQANTWHHYIASTKDNVLRIWLDGELKTEQTRSNPALNSGASFYIRGVLFDQVMVAPIGFESL